MYMKIKDGILKYALPPFDAGHCAIPEGVTKIDAGAFANSDELESVSFPSSLKEIGERAFFHCVSLKTLQIPSHVEHVGESAFRECKSLTEFTCDASKTLFDWNCFRGCPNLKRYHNGTEWGRLFYFPKHDQFGVGIFHRETERKVSVFVGRYTGWGFPSSWPVGPSKLYFATASDYGGNEYFYSSVDEDEAIEGAYLQAHHETIREHFGVLYPDTVVSPRKLSLICGMCSVGTRRWCEDNKWDLDQEVTIQDALIIFKKYLPGAFRRLSFVLQHQDDVDDILSEENQLTDSEVGAITPTSTETRTVK